MSQDNSDITPQSFSDKFSYELFQFFYCQSSIALRYNSTEDIENESVEYWLEQLDSVERKVRLFLAEHTVLVKELMEICSLDIENINRLNIDVVNIFMSIDEEHEKCFINEEKAIARKKLKFQLLSAIDSIISIYNIKALLKNDANEELRTYPLIQEGMLLMRNMAILAHGGKLTFAEELSGIVQKGVDKYQYEFTSNRKGTGYQIELATMAREYIASTNNPTQDGFKTFLVNHSSTSAYRVDKFEFFGDKKRDKMYRQKVKDGEQTKKPIDIAVLRRAYKKALE